MDEEVEIARGRMAGSLLGNELLVEALAAMEMKYENAWINSQLSQTEIREEAFRMLRTVREFKQHLTRMVDTGKLATTARETRLEMESRQQRHSDWDGSADGTT